MQREKFAVQINNSYDSDSKIIYTITISMGDLQKSQKSDLRYSQLRSMHNEIEKGIEILKLYISLPSFPGRQIFGSTNKSAESVLKRQSELLLYLIDLLQIEPILGFPQVQRLLPQQDRLVFLSVKRSPVKVKIPKYQILDEVVVYHLIFTDTNAQISWSCKYRYSELRKISEALSDQNLEVKLPPFPQRKNFGSTLMNEVEEIEKRMELLEQYVNELFSIEEVYNSQVVQYFISISYRLQN